MTTMEFTFGMSIPFSMMDVASKTSPLPSVNCRTTSSRFFTCSYTGTRDDLLHSQRAVGTFFSSI